MFRFFPSGRKLRPSNVLELSILCYHYKAEPIGAKLVFDEHISANANVLALHGMHETENYKTQLHCCSLTKAIIMVTYLIRGIDDRTLIDFMKNPL